MYIYYPVITGLHILMNLFIIFVSVNFHCCILLYSNFFLSVVIKYHVVYASLTCFVNPNAVNRERLLIAIEHK